MIDILLNKIKNFSNKNNQYLVGEEIDKIIFFINSNKISYSNEKIRNKNSLKELAKYDYENKTINVPDDFSGNTENKHNFNLLKNTFNSNTASFIASHEMGHAIHHQSLGIDNNNYIKFSKYSPKYETNIDKFLERPLGKSTAIDDFLHMNFTEAYADCYAGLVHYLKDNNKQMIDDIFKFRESHHQTTKNNNSFKLKGNSPQLGKLSVTEYSNYHAVENFKNNFIDIFSSEDILKMIKEKGFGLVHDFIQIEAITGLKDTLINEVNNNPLFAKEFNEFCAGKNISIKDYITKFENHIEEERLELLKKVIKNDLSKHSDIIQLTKELNTDWRSYQPSDILDKLLNHEDKGNLCSFVKVNNYSDVKISDELTSKIVRNKSFESILNEVKNNNLSQYNTEVKSMLSQDSFNWIEKQANATPKFKLNQVQILSDKQIIDIYVGSLDKKGLDDFKKSNIDKLSLISVFHPSSNVLDATLPNISRSKNDIGVNILGMRDKFLSNESKEANKLKF